MKHTIKLTKNGTIEWLTPPPFNVPVSKQTKTRFSEITPTNPFLFISFRIIRALFGEGKWLIPEWTRQWKCQWKGTILIGKSAGETYINNDREKIITWEKEIWFRPVKGLDL